MPGGGGAADHPGGGGGGGIEAILEVEAPERLVSKSILVCFISYPISGHRPMRGLSIPT